MRFELLLSNGHSVEWIYRPFNPDNAYVSNAMSALFQQKVVLCRHLGSGRNEVWVNTRQIIFAEAK